MQIKKIIFVITIIVSSRMLDAKEPVKAASSPALKAATTTVSAGNIKKTVPAINVKPAASTTAPSSNLKKTPSASNVKPDASTTTPAKPSAGANIANAGTAAQIVQASVVAFTAASKNLGTNAKEVIKALTSLQSALAAQTKLIADKKLIGVSTTVVLDSLKSSYQALWKLLLDPKKVTAKPLGMFGFASKTAYLDAGNFKLVVDLLTKIEAELAKFEPLAKPAYTTFTDSFKESLGKFQASAQGEIAVVAVTEMAKAISGASFSTIGVANAAKVIEGLTKLNNEMKTVAAKVTAKPAKAPDCSAVTKALATMQKALDEKTTTVKSTMPSTKAFLDAPTLVKVKPLLSAVEATLAGFLVKLGLTVDLKDFKTFITNFKAGDQAAQFVTDMSDAISASAGIRGLGGPLVRNKEGVLQELKSLGKKLLDINEQAISLKGSALPKDLPLEKNLTDYIAKLDKVTSAIETGKTSSVAYVDGATIALIQNELLKILNTVKAVCAKAYDPDPKFESIAALIKKYKQEGGNEVGKLLANIEDAIAASTGIKGLGGPLVRNAAGVIKELDALTKTITGMRDQCAKMTVKKAPFPAKSTLQKKIADFLAQLDKATSAIPTGKSTTAYVDPDMIKTIQEKLTALIALIEDFCGKAFAPVPQFDDAKATIKKYKQEAGSEVVKLLGQLEGEISSSTGIKGLGGPLVRNAAGVNKELDSLIKDLTAINGTLQKITLKAGPVPAKFTLPETLAAFMSKLDKVTNTTASKKTTTNAYLEPSTVPAIREKLDAILDTIEAFCKKAFNPVPTFEEARELATNFKKQDLQAADEAAALEEGKDVTEEAPEELATEGDVPGEELTPADEPVVSDGDELIGEDAAAPDAITDDGTINGDELPADEPPAAGQLGEGGETQAEGNELPPAEDASLADDPAPAPQKLQAKNSNTLAHKAPAAAGPELELAGDSVLADGMVAQGQQDDVATPGDESGVVGSSGADDEPAKSDDVVETPPAAKLTVTQPKKTATSNVLAPTPDEAPTVTSASAAPSVNVQVIQAATTGKWDDFKRELTNGNQLTAFNQDTGNSLLQDALEAQSPLVVMHMLKQFQGSITPAVLQHENNQGKTPLASSLSTGGSQRLSAVIALLQKAKGVAINAQEIEAGTALAPISGDGQSPIWQEPGVVGKLLRNINGLPQAKASGFLGSIIKEYNPQGDPKTVRGKVNKAIDGIVGQIVKSK